MSMSIGDSNYHICWCFKKVYTDKKTTLLSDKALSRVLYIYIYIGRFIMFSVITNIYNKKTKVPTLMEFFTATGKLKKFFFFDN